MNPVVNSADSINPILRAFIEGGFVMYVILVIGVLAVIGAAAMMRAWGLGSADVAHTGIAAGLSAALFSLATALFAAMSSDARAAMLGAALTLAAFFTLDRFWPSSLSRPGSMWWRMASLAVIVADVAALVRLYRLREVAPQWRAGSGVLVAATFLCALMASRSALDANIPPVAAEHADAGVGR